MSLHVHSSYSSWQGLHDPRHTRVRGANTEQHNGGHPHAQECPDTIPKDPNSPYLWFLVPKKALKSYNREYLDPLGIFSLGLGFRVMPTYSRSVGPLAKRTPSPAETL